MKKRLDFFVYTAFGTCIFILLFMLAYITTHFDAETFSTRQPGSYSILSPDIFESLQSDTAPLHKYNELIVTVPQVDKKGSNLIFYVKHESVKVYIDSELVYSLAPDEGSFIKTPGANWCIIPIYPDDAGKTIKIILTPLYKSMTDTCPTIYFGSQYKIYEHLLAPNIIIYLTCLLAVLCGAFFIIFPLVNINNKHVDKSLIMIGIFSILIGLWKFMDLDYTALIIRNPIAKSYTSYFSLLLMTIPFITFLRSSFTDRDNFLWYIPCIGNIIVFIIIMVLQIAGIADIRDNLWLIHAVMLSNIPVAFIMFYKEITEYGWNPKLKLTFICSFTCLVGLLADIAAYYISNGAFPSFLGITCLLFYIISLGASSLKEARRLMAIGSHAKDFEEMAYHDQLTGLYNRTAYAKYINHKDFKPDGHIVVMFDLNNLKKCNDSLGHEQGDNYIMESARIIKKAFGAFGNCYRMGGDEFCVLLHNVSIAKCAGFVDTLTELLDAYNNANPDRFPLNIALGYELYDPDEDYDIGDTLRRADKMMYSEKFEMKKKNHETVH